MYEWQTSVVLIRNRHSEILLVQQNYGYRFFGLPGGKIEDGEDPASAAIRELREETGLITTSVTPIGEYDLTYPGTGAKYKAHAFESRGAWGDLEVQMPDEISLVGWFSSKQLPQPLAPSANAVLSLVA